MTTTTTMIITMMLMVMGQNKRTTLDFGCHYNNYKISNKCTQHGNFNCLNYLFQHDVVYDPHTLYTHTHTHIDIKCVECSFTLTLSFDVRSVPFTQLLPFSLSFLFQCFYYGVDSEMQARASDELFYIISVVIFRTCIHSDDNGMQQQQQQHTFRYRTTSMGWNDSVIRTYIRTHYTFIRNFRL